MIALERHDDVLRVRMSHARSRAIGYDVSAYLVRGVLVDTGFAAIAPEVERLLRERRPAGVVVTHHHEDHAGNVGLAARLGIPVLASPLTLEALRHPRRVGLYRRFTWGLPPALDADVVPFEPEGLELVPTPGHARDHHVLWDAETRTIFGGDLFLGVKVRIAHPGEDPRELVRSLRRVAALRPRRLFDAHRGLVPDPGPALLAKADWIEETIAAIERLADRGLGERAIRNQVLGREDLAGWVSRGDYSRANFVRSVLRTRGEGRG